jgi:hypothetical protein
MKRPLGLFSILAACSLLSAPMAARAADDPVLKLTAPHFVFLPFADPRGPRPTVQVRVTAELEGEPDDPEEYYCLDEEWEWDDDTNPARHEVDCDPYEPGMEITRRFSSSHTYRYPGSYNITLRLMLGDKTIVYGKIQVQINER